MLRRPFCRYLKLSQHNFLERIPASREKAKPQRSCVVRSKRVVGEKSICWSHKGQVGLCLGGCYMIHYTRVYWNFLLCCSCMQCVWINRRRYKSLLKKCSKNVISLFYIEKSYINVKYVLQKLKRYLNYTSANRTIIRLIKAHTECLNWEQHKFNAMAEVL